MDSRNTNMDGAFLDGLRWLILSLFHLCVLWGRCTVVFCCPESKRLRQGKEVGLRNVSWMWPRLYLNPRGRMPNDSLRYQSDIDS